MPKSAGKTPFSHLGARLRHFRETRQESIAEVAGAIEIDIDALERIEHGAECPTEDILMLLISHFDVREQDAAQLCEWAGISRSGDARGDFLQELASRATLVLVALDSRVLYTDNAVIVTDQNGVVLNFMQIGPQGQPLPIARVGMSYEQAAQVMDALQRALLRKKYLPKNNLLPPGDKPAA